MLQCLPLEFSLGLRHHCPFQNRCRKPSAVSMQGSETQNCLRAHEDYSNTELNHVNACEKNCSNTEFTVHENSSEI